MKNLFIFALGAGVGSIITWKLIEKKYKDIADEEIADVVEHYKTKYNDNAYTIETTVQENIPELLRKNNDEKTLDQETIPELLRKNNDEKIEDDINNHVKDYISHSDIDNTEDNNFLTPIEIITEETFGDKEEYDTKAWMYYSNGIVTDEYDMEVTNYQKYIGNDFKNEIKNDECGTVYIRNNDLKCDYEICSSELTYNG